LAGVSLSIWVLPYINQFNSRRAFSKRIKELVPATAPLYIYADRMDDFNFYTEREVIPVLSSPAEVENAHRQLGSSYMLIKEKDLRKLSTVDPGGVLIAGSISSTSWNLVALKLNDGVTVPLGIAPP
jgi:hypothetical protein